MAKQIYVGNLSYNMTDEELKGLFDQHGEVLSVKIIRYPDTKRSKGFGFVEMANDNEAETAIEELNGTEFLGRNLKINIARPKREFQ